MCICKFTSEVPGGPAGNLVFAYEIFGGVRILCRIFFFYWSDGHFPYHSPFILFTLVREDRGVSMRESEKTPPSCIRIPSGEPRGPDRGVPARNQGSISGDAYFLSRGSRFLPHSCLPTVVSRPRVPHHPRGRIKASSGTRMYKLRPAGAPAPIHKHAPNSAPPLSSSFCSSSSCTGGIPD